MTPGSDEDTIRLLDRFLRAMAALTHRIREEHVSDGDRQEILEARDLAHQLSGQIRNGQSADDELIAVVEALTESLQLSPTLWLSPNPESPGQLSAQELHEEARIAFYTLRAHLFPDGRVWES